MTKEEKKYKEALVELGCMLCRELYGITDSPVELHHYRSGGWGKGDYTTLIPLCDKHHRGNQGIHFLGTKGFDHYYDPISQKSLLEKTLILMNRK